MGEEAAFPLEEGTRLVVRHGSSLSITANVCTFLANSDTFDCIDPNTDHHKWGRKGLSLYYVCVVDESSDISAAGENGGIVCALRAAINEFNNNSRNNIFLIDYVYTDPNHRERDIAGKLISKVLDMAKSAGSILGVLSLEESCVYWLEKWNVLLCQNKVLNDRLNVFPDTHLLIHKECNVDAIMDERDCETKINTDAASILPPEQFGDYLRQLQIIGTTQSSGVSEVFSTIAELITNAKNDESDRGRRRTIRINNKVIHQKVLARGG
jgi:GNAT superfamily N-acetyltransferase